MEEFPCKRRRVRWLCMTTTKTHQLRENSPEPPSLCTACEAFRARALPAAQRPPFSTTESQWFPSLRQTLWIQAILWHCCRSSPREASGQLRLGAPISPVPITALVLRLSNPSFPHSALLLGPSPVDPAGSYCLLPGPNTASSKQKVLKKVCLWNERLIIHTNEKPLKNQK